MELDKFDYSIDGKHLYANTMIKDNDDIDTRKTASNSQQQSKRMFWNSRKNDLTPIIW